MARIAGEIGAQPRPKQVLAAGFEDRAARISVALDGEIANRAELRARLEPRGYRFADGGSAEVLARAYQHWDKDAVRHLRGAFALAVWDAGKERLLLARDRFGEKPLFVHEAGGALAFASEPAALLANPRIERRVDAQAVRECLRYRYVPGARTLYEGIRRLAPGAYLLWQFGRSRESRYWTPPDREARAERAGEAQAPRAAGAEPVQAFIAELDEAVRMRVAEAASPGVLLGGGFDSAALLALAARHAKRVKTFTAGLRGSSELARAARLAKHFGAEHQEIVLSTEQLCAALPGAVAARGAPLAQPAELALHALAGAASGGTDLVLTGEGADEILGGYRRHALARLAIVRVEPPPGTADADPHASRLRRVLYYEQSARVPQLAERAERFAACVAVEARAPFLDHRLAEHVSALPDEMRCRGLTTKWIVRQAVRRLVPAAAGRPRQGGFGIGARDWLRNELRDCLVEHLRDPSALARDFMDPAALERLLEEHLSCRRDHQDDLWTLLNLEIWHRAFRHG
jgi:asparagine synthase (glutamine-hydrolysing)